MTARDRRVAASVADWPAWTAEQVARYPVAGKAVLVRPGAPDEAVDLRHRYKGGGYFVTRPDGSSRVVPDVWIVGPSWA